jgi:serine/threonine-protein kinase RsbW
MQTEQTSATGYTGMYPGRADQARHVRHAVAEYLAGCPAADDAILIASELASNAILHSASQGAFFIIRAEVRAAYIWVEAEDLGGPWHRGQHDDRPHGLDVIEALTGTSGWGVDTTSDGHRVVWARLDLPAGDRGAKPSPGPDGQNDPFAECVTCGGAGTSRTSPDGTPCRCTSPVGCLAWGL